MSMAVFLSLALLSAVLALGQWVFFKVFGSKPGYLSLFGGLLLTNIAIIFIKGLIR